MKQIVLSDGSLTTVDDEDYFWLAGWRWTKGKYAYRAQTKAEQREELRQLVLMHRVIAARAGYDIADLEIDHIDRDKLNNQRLNLRPVTRSQNQHNVGVRDDSTSRVTGVNWHHVTKKWAARIQVRGTRTHLGLFDTLDQAVAARDVAKESML